MTIRRMDAGRMIAVAILVACISPAGASDEPYVNYIMRQVSEGLRAQHSASVVERLEGAHLAALYTYNLRKEHAPTAFVEKISETLLQWLAEEDEPWVRHFLVEAVGEADAQWNRSHLRGLLQDRDPTVRARAAGYIPAPLTAQEERDLIQRLAVEELWWVKKEILLALAHGTTDDSLVLLHRGLNDPSRDIRAAASVALASRPDARNVEPLLDALDSANLFGNESPVWALGAIKSPAATDALQRLADSAYPLVRMGAASAMGEARETKCVPTLGRLLEDEDPMVQEVAAEALADVGGREAALHLLEYLSHHETDKMLYAALRIDRDVLRQACETLLEGSPEPSNEGQRRRRVCALVSEHINDAPLTFWSSGDFHSVFYSVFNAKAREVAPKKGHRIIGWEDFIGRQNDGTRHVFHAGTRVTIWKAAYYRGETWLEVTEGPYDPETWVREADLRIISPEELRHLAIHTNYGADTQISIRTDHRPNEEVNP